MIRIYVAISVLLPVIYMLSPGFGTLYGIIRHKKYPEVIRLTLNSSKNTTYPTSNRDPKSNSDPTNRDNYEFLYQKVTKYEADGSFCARRDLHVTYTLYKDDPSINEVAIMVTYQIHSRALTMRRVLYLLDREAGWLKSIDAGIGIISRSWPILNGSLNQSYKIRIEDHFDEKYVVQTRSHGYIESTAPFMKFLRAEYSDVFPVLETYTSTRRSKQGQCIQIYKMVPGILGSIHYPKLPFKEKVRILKALGRAYGAIWDMEPRLGILTILIVILAWVVIFHRLLSICENGYK
ncbi:uncharacterized protein LAJ45_02602 [Morchella importuna]|uniref:uncharacterized protein n=1 Tax=Morchella importuna TaxID=1174673 RepID=UPI001E8EC1A2|nr:uncharacterized protein LAJ45_02602 [Morchella importuna]KAH8153015.1 hypothetical protein LAJ45_02602 [Morchella importuna]